MTICNREATELLFTVALCDQDSETRQWKNRCGGRFTVVGTCNLVKINGIINQDFSNNKLATHANHYFTYSERRFFKRINIPNIR